MISACGKYYDGKPSDHFDGTRFSNLGVEPKLPAFAYWRWQFTAKRKPWPDKDLGATLDLPPARVLGKELRVSFIGHATVLLQTEGLNILTDPVYADRASPLSFAGPKRVNPPGVAFDNLPKIDVVLVSHNHYDHMDLEFLERIWKRDRPHIISPLGNERIIQGKNRDIQVSTLDWGDALAVNNDVSVHLEAAYHWSARGIFDRMKALWGAFVMKTPGGSIYFAGDTGYRDGKTFKAIPEKYGPVRLALLPIGAYQPEWFMRGFHMNPAEALQAAGDLQAAHNLAIHYGTFQMADDGFDDPVTDLEKALAEKHISKDTFRTLKVGETWLVP